MKKERERRKKEKKRLKLEKEKKLKLQKKREKLKLKKQKELEKKKLREKEKKQRKREKHRLKMAEHKRMLKSEANHRYYMKKSDPERQRRIEIGDDYGFYMILLTKNRRRMKRLGAKHWRTDAFELYNNLLEENNKDIKFPETKCTKVLENNVKEIQDLEYELLLVKSLKKDESNISRLMNKDGKFIENVANGKTRKYLIIKKDIWLTEETFAVYGYHPKTDRKTYQFILDNLILNKPDTPDEMKRIMMYNNKLIIENIDDFDFVSCKDKEQCLLLYDKIQNNIFKMKRKYIVFMGKVADAVKWIDKIHEKTGWPRSVCKRINGI